MHDVLKAWSSLSPDSTQLLICDLQEQIVARSKTNPPDELSKSAEVICELAKLFNIPITFSLVPEGNEAPKLIAPLKPFANGTNQFLRASASPFIDKATPEHLKSLKRKTLLLAGFATEVVVLHAALHAVEAGLNPIIVVDACGGMSERTESAALEQVWQGGGIVSSVVSIATALSPDFTQETGQKMFQVVQKLRLA
ncbi:cysteine hydrolase [Silvibacterium acidisoli]|uniref:cysteine hydrolase n=1 Tax=Acidobacteriaceae bacterium ZG23-2 TaxID=2883246 RepID=UPI00406BF360